MKAFLILFPALTILGKILQPLIRSESIAAVVKQQAKKVFRHLKVPEGGGRGVRVGRKERKREEGGDGVGQIQHVNILYMNLISDRVDTTRGSLRHSISKYIDVLSRN